MHLSRQECLVRDHLRVNHNPLCYIVPCAVVGTQKTYLAQDMKTVAQNGCPHDFTSL